MCLGIPGRITEVRDGEFVRMGTVDFDGVAREVCLECAPEANIGDYVLVHVGFAISTIDEDEAHRTLEALRELGALQEELGEDPGAAR